MILGMPFLRKNKLVIDACERSVIDKRSGYDLMKGRWPSRGARRPKKCTDAVPSYRRRSTDARAAPRVSQPPKEKTTPRVSQPPRVTIKPEMTPGEKKPTPSRSTDGGVGTAPEYRRPVSQEEVATVVAAIRERIEVLASVEEYAKWDAQAKERFRDRFPIQLPEVSALPDAVYHNIRLKDANKVMAARSYACPKKYREEWQTLLKQHVEAGRLRRSDSPYSSPAFLIPKADPTELPRMVCDY